MIKRLKHIIVVLLAGLVSVACAQDEEVWVKLYGSSDSDKVKLYWDCFDWPEDLIGFEIKKLNEDTWVSLHDEPVVPMVKTGRSFSNQGLTTDEGNGLSKLQQNYIDEGLVNEVDAK